MNWLWETTAGRAIVFSILASLLITLSLRKLRVSLHLEYLWAVLRAGLQLALLGFALKYVFELPPLIGAPLSWLVMIAFATQVATSRAVDSLSKRALRVHPLFLTSTTFSLIALTFSTVMGTLLLMGAVEVRSSAMIPLGGMLLGNTVMALSLTYERLAGELRARGMLVEGLAAVGVSPKRLISLLGPWVLSSVLVPRVDNLKAMGLVWIPGLMTGLVLAGMSPIQASAYQLMIMVAIFTNTLMLSAAAVYLIGPKLIAENFF